MAVAVYSRLHELLQARNLTVTDLERQIKQRFGLSVDPRTLYRLTHTDAVQRAELEIVGAAATVLGVGLSDLFDVQAIPVGRAMPAADLSPEQSRRLADLFDRQANAVLSPAEQDEIETLLAEYGQRLHERRLRDRAEHHDLPIDRVRREAEAELERAVGWWQAFEADPARRRAIAARAMRHRARTHA